MLKSLTFSMFKVEIPKEFKVRIHVDDDPTEEPWINTV